MSLIVLVVFNICTCKPICLWIKIHISRLHSWIVLLRNCHIWYDLKELQFICVSLDPVRSFVLRDICKTNMRCLWSEMICNASYLFWNIGPPFVVNLFALVSSFSHEPKYPSYPFSEEISGSLWGPFLLHWVLCQRKKLVLFMKTETFNAISKSYKRCFLEVFIMIPLLGLGLLWTLMCTSCTFCPLVWCATICQVDLIWFSHWWSHFLSHAIKSSFNQKISNAMRSYAIYIYIKGLFTTRIHGRNLFLLTGKLRNTSSVVFLYRVRIHRPS